MRYPFSYVAILGKGVGDISISYFGLRTELANYSFLHHTTQASFQEFCQSSL